MTAPVLWGRTSDIPFADVLDALVRAGCEPIVLDDRHLDTDDWETSGHQWPRLPSVDLDDVASFYFRPYEVARTQLLVAWLDVTSAKVINRPAAMASNQSKPFQASLIRAAGFLTPDTLVTTDIAEARAFVAAHRSVVYKSISGWRSVVAAVEVDDPRLAGPLTCPTQFQRRVPGPDLRVHVVAERLFGCEITSSAVDYRYARRDGHELRMSEVPVPPDVGERAVALCRDLGLVVGGLDLRRDGDGAWVCFEVNPSPAFSFFDRAVHEGRIASAIATELRRR